MDNTDLKTEAPFVKMSINVILTGAISKASGGDFYQGAMRALVVYLYNDLTFKQTMHKLWRKLTDGTIANNVSKAVDIGYKESAKMAPRVAKFMVFQGEEYNSVMQSKTAPWYAKLMLQASVTLIEDGLTAGISDAELKMAYDMFSGFFAPTAPKSWAGFAGYYERQYYEAFINDRSNFYLEDLIPYEFLK